MESLSRVRVFLCVSNARLRLFSAQTQMISRGGGSIINMSSICSSVMNVERRSVYGAAKAAVIGLTKAIAKEHANQGIRYTDAFFFNFFFFVFLPEWRHIFSTHLADILRSGCCGIWKSKGNSPLTYITDALVYQSSCCQSMLCGLVPVYSILFYFIYLFTYIFIYLFIYLFFLWNCYTLSSVLTLHREFQSLQDQ